MLHCDLRVRWNVASDVRFRAAISAPKTPSFCGISGDLAPSTRKSLAIAIVRFWCAKPHNQNHFVWVAQAGHSGSQNAQDTRCQSTGSCESWLAFLILEPGNPPAISQGCENGVFGKRCFCPLPKTGDFDEKWRK